MKKKFIFSTLLLVLISSCNTTNNNNNGDNKGNDDPIIINKKELIFEHEFKKGEISSSLTPLSVNGLTFNYTTSTMFSFDSQSGRGVQIGSSNKPQLEGWTIETSFSEEVEITSYSIYMGSAKGKDGCTGTVSYGEYSYTHTLTTTSTVLNEYKFDGSSYSTNNFKLNMIAGNGTALYLKSIKIGFKVNENSSFNVTNDYGKSDGSKNDDTDEVTEVIPGEKDIPSLNYTLKTKEEYYSTIDFTDTANLVTNLRTLISTSITNINYGDARYCLQYTDEDPTNKGYIYSLLDGDLIVHDWDYGKSWNREHVWPRSRMILNNGTTDCGNDTTGNYSDLHNLRAACSNANSKHGNAYYGNEGEVDMFYPNVTSGLDSTIREHSYSGDFRGDVARICFYMYVRYEGLTLTDDTTIETNNMARLSLLKEWDKADPIDEFEIQRNNRVYEYQGNRNPFIDYEGLIDKIM